MSSDPQAADPTPSLRDWLARLGLERYADTFEREAIDFAVLPELGEAQLIQLGIAALGDRLKLQRAIAQWVAAAGERAAAAPIDNADTERRQITVLFCDLVGSTALSQQLDPEDLRALMQRYQRICAGAVQRGDGHVAQFLGDGLMVYFGWPRAHEDDAERAVHVALEIVEAVAALQAAQPLAVRIGICTGPVVVGAAGGADATLPRTAVGETPNLAARAQAEAAPGQVVVAPGTRRLLGSSFDLEDLGERALKGVAQPLRLWRVLGAGRAEGRFAAAHGTQLTPMVNRSAELTLMLERWSRVQQGKGQAVLLVGEPGMGKSRIAAEICERVGGPHVLLLRAQCSELHQHSALYPLITQLKRASGFERGDTPETRLDKLETLLRRLGNYSPHSAPHYAALLSLPLTRYPALLTSAAKRRRDTIEVLVQGVLDAARTRTVLLLFEDLHWMDPSTLELIDALVAAIPRARVLLIMTSRASLAARWGALPHVSSHALAGLDYDHSLQLARAVVSAHGLPAQVLERIVARTDGVPLFVQEMTRAVLDVGPGPDAIEIPATLKDSLTARLDQLGAAKRVAQLGSVLGRQFRHDVLLAFCGLADAELHGHLDRLLGSGLVDRSGDGAGASYSFHHALVQDAAYESLLRSERRRLHARAGEVLAAQFPDVAEHEPELLARHFAAGDDHARAVPLWLEAGQRAWQRSAAAEAIAHLGAGLDSVQRLREAAAGNDDDSALASLELRLQSALGVVYFAAVSYAAPQAQQAFLRALALCERVSDVALKVPVLYGVGAFQTMKGDIDAGHSAFERLRAEADAAAQPRLQLYAQSVLTWSHYNRGEHDAAVAAADRTLRLYESGALSGPRLSAADPKIISECFRAVALWSLGHADQARHASDGVLAHARALGDPYSLAYSLNFAALLVPDLCGDLDTVIERGEEGVRLAAELGYPFLEVFGSMFLASARGTRGDEAAAQGALDAMEQSFVRLYQLGVRYHHGQLLARKARLLLKVGQEGAAQLAISQAVAELEVSGLHAIEPDIRLAEAEVLLAHGGEQRKLAEAAFNLAHDLAAEQGARGWQLRAATALARLAAADGDADTARALLQPLLASLDEGHDTSDHRAAVALLAALG